MQVIPRKHTQEEFLHVTTEIPMVVCRIYIWTSSINLILLYKMPKNLLLHYICLALRMSTNESIKHPFYLQIKVLIVSMNIIGFEDLDWKTNIRMWEQNENQHTIHQFQMTICSVLLTDEIILVNCLTFTSGGVNRIKDATIRWKRDANG